MQETIVQIDACEKRVEDHVRAVIDKNEELELQIKVLNARNETLVNQIKNDEHQTKKKFKAMDEKIFELHNLLRDEDLSSDADEVKELLEDPESAV